MLGLKLDLVVCCVLLTTTTAFCHTMMPESEDMARDETDFRARLSMQRLMAKSTLNYYDNCSFEDEKQRLDIIEDLFNLSFQLNFTQAASAPIVAKIDRLLTTSNGNFCKMEKNLYCTSAGLCDCGRGPSPINIRPIYENGECVLAASSPCGSVVGPSYKCQAGSECVLNRGGLPCTDERMGQALRESYLSYGGEPDALKVMDFIKKSRYLGSFCACSG